MNLIPHTAQSTPTRLSRTARCLASCRKLLAQIAHVKAALLGEFRQTVRSHEHLLELALNEAEAMAWQTGYPHLVFPTLAAEKVRAVATWHARQERLQQARPRLAIAA
jgi:hypothetical protein